jgi:hypothetical protein
LIIAEPHLTAVWLQSRKQQPLLFAARHGLWEACKHLLSTTKLPVTLAYAALYDAAAAGQVNMAMRLMDACEEAPNIVYGNEDPNSLGRLALTTSFRDAASRGDLRMCQALISRIPDLTAIALNSHGMGTPVRCAAHRGHVAVVLFFLDECRKYQPEQLAGLQNAAMQSAAQEGQVDVLQALLDRGVDVNAGRQAFHEEAPLARALAFCRMEAVQLLLQHGVYTHADTTSEQPTSALSFAISRLTGDKLQKVVHMLLSCEGMTVGGPELAAAVRSSSSSILHHLMASESKVDPELRQDHRRRAACLANALLLAIELCEEHTGSMGRAERVEGIQALLFPPSHWLPMPPGLLAQVVQTVVRICEAEAPAKNLCALIKVLHRAGADLHIDDGALLRAAAAQYWFSDVVKAIIQTGPLATAHVKAALQVVNCHEAAALLIKASCVAVHQDPELFPKLMVLALKWPCKVLHNLLVS